ncbi:unnamed protein product [Dimorphilus gyrociliatus]|uniref:PAS domain-containing protein n=1 Tax=Dimorphilus gyrociliatus TaxID=2664684 RepID=A0A7I8VB20_9ANNE|nr:unnamed protein product [Dimorphilus gyrociliatus]
MMTQGDSIYDIIDKRDHSIVQSQLANAPFNPNPLTGMDERNFFCKMNVSRTLRRQTGFGDHKVMHIQGHFIQAPQQSDLARQPVFMAVCSPLITPDVKESLIQNNTMVFQTVHCLDMKYMEMAYNGEFHLGYTENEIQGLSWYKLIHPEDVQEAKEKHSQLIKSSHEMGCMLTLRMFAKDGTWIWVNLVMHIRQPTACNNGEPAIVCINHVLREADAVHFKLQSQMYSSHIARSPEVLTQSGSSPSHSITPIRVEKDSLPPFSGFATQLESPSSVQSSTPPSASPSFTQLSDKPTIKQDIQNRIKRKLDNSSNAKKCGRPKKARLNSSSSSGSGTSIESFNQPISVHGSVCYAPVEEASDVQYISNVLPNCFTPINLKAESQVDLGVYDKIEDIINMDRFEDNEETIMDDTKAKMKVEIPWSLLTPDSSPIRSPPIEDLENRTNLLADVTEVVNQDQDFTTRPQNSADLPTLDVLALEDYLDQVESPAKDETKDEAENLLFQLNDSQLSHVVAMVTDLLVNIMAPPSANQESPKVHC